MAGTAHAAEENTESGASVTAALSRSQAQLKKEEEEARRRSPPIKVAKAEEMHSRASTAAKRVENEHQISATPVRYAALIGRSTPPTRLMTAKTLGAGTIPTIAAQLGGSHGMLVSSNNAHHMIMHNSNLFKPRTPMFSAWRNQWASASDRDGDTHRRLFSFSN